MWLLVTVHLADEMLFCCVDVSLQQRQLLVNSVISLHVVCTEHCGSWELWYLNLKRYTAVSVTSQQLLGN